VVPTAARCGAEQGIICLGCLRALLKLVGSTKWKRIIAFYERGLDGPTRATPLARVSKHVEGVFPKRVVGEGR
jgi:hypothetical protein